MASRPALDYATGVMVLEAIARIDAESGTTTAVIKLNAPIANMADGCIALVERNERKLSSQEITW